MLRQNCQNMWKANNDSASHPHAVETLQLEDCREWMLVAINLKRFWVVRLIVHVEMR